MNRLVEYYIEKEKNVKAYLRKNIKHAGDTEDIYQEVMVVVLSRPPSIEKDADIEPLAYTIVNRTVSNFYTRQNDDYLIGDLEAEKNDEGRCTEPYTFDQLYEYQADLARDPMEILMQEQEDGEIRELISTVSNEKHREFLRWHLLGKVSRKKSAEYVGLSHRNGHEIIKLFKRAHGL